jgi:predicted ATPase
MAEWRAMGAEYLVPYFLALLAQVELGAGRPDAAIELLAEARARVEQTGERWYEAEILRLEGEALLALGDSGRLAEAEACLARAIRASIEVQARFWELRAATSLARLWAGRGEWCQARDLLAPVHGWFTEGLDMPDLQEAKALLDELACYRCG